MTEAAVTPGRQPLRLLAEVLAILALLQAALAWGLVALPTPGGAAQAAVFNGLLLILLAAPALYWRCMQATRSTALLAAADTGRAGWPAAEAGPGRHRHRAIAAVALAQVLGLAVTGVVMWRVQSELQQAARLRYERHVERLEADIRGRFETALQGLRGVRAAVLSEAGSRRRSFADYVDAHDMPREFPGLYGLGFIQRVPRPDLASFVAAQQADGAPDFAVRSAGDAADLYVIQHIEPLAPNRPARGYDVGSEAVRREAVLRAVRSGEPALTGRIALLQEQRSDPGFLLLLPVYAGPAVPADAAAREAALRGLVYAPIGAARLLAHSVDTVDGQLDFELFDGDGGSVDQLLFDADRHLAGRTGALDDQDLEDRLFHGRRPLVIGGRSFTLRTSTTAAFQASIDRRPLLYIAVAGSLLSLLAALAVWALAVGRLRALSLAHRMTADLDRLAKVVRHTTNAVAITDPACRITWLNDGFTRLTGRSLAAVAGQPLGEVLAGADADADRSAVQALAAAVAAGGQARVDIALHPAGGGERWMDLELQPLRDGQGALVGFMAIGSDISAQRLVREQLEAALRENGALLRALHARFLVSVTDADGRITEVNDLFCQLSGYSREQLLGQNHRLLNAGVMSRDDWGGVWRAITAGETWRGEVCDRARDGSLFWVDAVIVPILGRDGRPEKFVSIRADVSGHRRAEMALRDSEHLVRLVTDHIPGRLAYFDSDLRLQFANKPSYAFYGGSPESLKGCRFEDFVGPAFAERQLPYVTAALAGEPQVYEFERTLADGAKVYSEVHFIPDLRDGQVRGFVGLAMDVSAVKRAEHELRRAEALLRGAIDTVNEAFVLFDPDDRLVFCNDKYRELYAASADVIVPGSSFEQILRTGVQRGQHAAAAGQVEAWVAERLAVHRSGDRTLVQRLDDGRWLRVVERRMADGHTVGFRIDITELVQAREQAESASRDSAQALARLRAIYDILPVGLTITDPQGHIIDCNPAAERLLGTARAELLACDNPEWTVLREDGSTLPPAEWAGVRALRSGQAVHGAVMQVLTPQRSLWLSVSAMPAGHADLGVVVGYVDVTEQRAQQAALVQAKAQAEQASVAKSRFVANMSHEIRTPMNAVLGMLTLLGRTALDARQQDYAAKAERAARTLLGLLNNVLDSSKIDAGKLELDPRPFRLDDLLRDLSDILSVQLDTRPVALRFEVDPDMPAELVADELRLRQVLVNLGGNAVKFTEQGEVVVGVRVLARNLTDVLLGFSVRDTGMGIAPEAQQRIFQGFSQAEASTTRRFGGTGLGLSISRQLVELMGGELTLDSRPGEGSCFSFDLPLALPDEAAPACPLPRGPSTRSAAPERRLQGLRLLVVEDNANNQQIAQELLTDEGADITLAADGALGVAAVAAADPPFDLVLMDMQMPVMDGLAAASQIRQRLGLWQLPIVAMTANAMASDRDACLAAGMNDHVGKPFDLDALVATVLRHVRRAPAGAMGTADRPPATVRPAWVLPPALLDHARTRGFELGAALERMNGRVDVYLRLAGNFAAGLAGHADELQQCLADGSVAEAARQMHTLKGLAATLGAQRLSQLARQAEQALSDPDPGQPGAATTAAPGAAVAVARSVWTIRLREACAQASHDLGHLLAALREATQAPDLAAGELARACDTDRAVLRQHLQALAALLSHHDMAATESLGHLQRACGEARATALAPLVDAVSRLDFDAALRHCNALADAWAA